MDNMKFYNALCTPPTDALKPIEYGKLKGKSDIKPQWRYEALTNTFGPCGIGWKFTIDNYMLQPVEKTGEIMVFVQVSLSYKDGETWSDPIPGWGGDFVIQKDKNGFHGNDEAMKMAVTDALGTAAKMVGVAADVYRGLIANGASDSKYTRRDEAKKNEQEAQSEPKKKEPTISIGGPQNGAVEVQDAVLAAANKRLTNVILAKGLTREYIVDVSQKVVGKTARAEMTAAEMVKLAEALEAEQ